MGGCVVGKGDMSLCLNCCNKGPHSHLDEVEDILLVDERAAKVDRGTPRNSTKSRVVNQGAGTRGPRSSTSALLLCIAFLLVLVPVETFSCGRSRLIGLVCCDLRHSKKL